jgi:hypothetical protein
MKKLKDLFINIARAINDKSFSNDKISPFDFPERIRKIPQIIDKKYVPVEVKISNIVEGKSKKFFAEVEVIKNENDAIK